MEIQPSREQKALHSLLGRADTTGRTVAEAQAQLDALRTQLDERWEVISLAKRQAARVRSTELNAAIRQRDQAIGAVLDQEGLIPALLDRYHKARQELARLYCALSALPIGAKPQGLWQEPGPWVSYKAVTNPLPTR